MGEYPKFLELCSIVDQLLGPEGCPWDKKQTLQTLRHSVLEETCELIEAIEEKEVDHMADELGDLLFNVIFLAKVAANEGHFTLDNALQKITNKLISRHPHVFGKGKALTSEHEVVAQWEQLKKQEATHIKRKSAMDGIPKTLPSLSRAQKMVAKMKKANYQERTVKGIDETKMTEETLGERLFELVRLANEQGLNAELALRKGCRREEKAFRTWET